MPGIARVGVDSCGGLVIDPKANTVFVNNAPIAVTGANVAGHAPGPHAAPKTSAHSPDVFAYNITVNRAGDACTCGDPLSGSGNVFAN